MEKKEMLEMLIQHYASGNQAGFARLIDISPAALGNWLNRETMDVEKIYNHCEDVSGDWLLSGKGEMLLSKRNVNTQNVNDDLLKENEQLRDELKDLRLRMKLMSDPEKSAKDGRVYRLWMKFMDITEEMQDLYREEKEG